MKKMLKTLVILFAVFCAVPTFGCAQQNSKVVTGSACSIAEINNLEKARTQDKVDFKVKQERDLRPVKLVPEVPKALGDDCILGVCLYKQMLGK